MRHRAVLVLLLPLVAQAAPAEPRGLQESLEVLRHVGPHNRGSREAAAAWKVVAAADAGQLPTLLAAMDGASPLARNWVRSAVDEVLDRARAGRQSLPAKGLETFVHDRRHDPQARRLAYELLTETDVTTAHRLLPHLLDDPSPELRRDAVAQLLERAGQLRKEDKKADAVGLFLQAFDAARDQAQLEQAEKGLTELGRMVNVTSHLGMVCDWKVIGPFPSPGGSGLDRPYPPEKAIDLDAAYDGKAGKVRWKDYASRDRYGLVDLNKAIGNAPDSVGYALAEFTANRARDVELRIGCYNAFKLWVNGDLVLDRRDAYTGMSLDHYAGKAHLRAGKNLILMKVCREDAPPPVPGLWRFQLRVCDDSGAGVLPASGTEGGKPK
jgi:hypothetical protein